MRELRDILAAQARWQGQELVVGTVVDVSGSSYRQPGARMLLKRTGERMGLISGGCLERDLVKNAFARTEQGPATVLYDTRGDHIRPAGRYGSGCDGLVKLLLERLSDKPAQVAFDAIADVFERRQPRVLATIFEATTAIDDLLGQRLVLDDGQFETPRVIPTKFAEELREVMGEAFAWKRPRTLSLQVGDEALSCLVEPILPPLDLLIFGAGDDVQPVARLAETLGWDVRLVDQWPAWTTRKRFPTARQVCCAPVEKWLETVEVNSNTYALVMTHDFEADTALLPDLLRARPAFVGLLGPRRRTRRLIDEMHHRQKLPDPGLLDCMQTPLGIDLGGEAPSEVALSVIAGVQAAYRRRDGGLIQHQDHPIHDRHRRMERTIEEAS